MSADGWMPINSAPKDGTRLLAYGQPDDIDGVFFTHPGVHTVYWDDLDEAFCLTGSTWLGPFISPTHWMPSPKPPVVQP